MARIRGRRLLISPLLVRRLIEGGAYSGAALIRVNTVKLAL